MKRKTIIISECKICFEEIKQEIYLNFDQFELLLYLDELEENKNKLILHSFCFHCELITTQQILKIK